MLAVRSLGIESSEQFVSHICNGGMIVLCRPLLGGDQSATVHLTFRTSGNQYLWVFDGCEISNAMHSIHFFVLVIAQ
jgi:hypothetical protein